MTFIVLTTLCKPEFSNNLFGKRSPFDKYLVLSNLQKGSDWSLLLVFLIIPYRIAFFEISLVTCDVCFKRTILWLNSFLNKPNWANEEFSFRLSGKGWLLLKGVDQFWIDFLILIWVFFCASLN